MSRDDVDFDTDDPKKEEEAHVQPKSRGMTWADDDVALDDDRALSEPALKAGALFGSNADVIGRKFDEAQKKYREASDAYKRYVANSKGVMTKLDSRASEIGKKMREAETAYNKLARLPPGKLPKGSASISDLLIQLENFKSGASKWQTDIALWREHVSVISSQRTARSEYDATSEFAEAIAHAAKKPLVSTGYAAVPSDAVEKGKEMRNGLVVHTQELQPKGNTSVLKTGSAGVYVHATGAMDVKTKKSNSTGESTSLTLAFTQGMQLPANTTFTLRNPGTNPVKVSYVGVN